MAIDLSTLTGTNSAPVTEVTASNSFDSIQLQKDMVFNLEKAAPTMTKAHIGLQWDAGNDYDLDLNVFSLHQNGKMHDASDLLYYDKQLTAPGLQKSGDNRTGAGDGDDEWLDIDFASVKADIDRIVLVVTIYDAQTRRQNFGMVRNARIHIDDTTANRELAKFELSTDASTDTAIVFGELVRGTDGWAFQSIGEGGMYDLGHYITQYQ